MENGKLKIAKNIADKYASIKGVKQIEDIVEPIKAGLDSTDPVVKEMSVQQGRAVVTDLTRLILRQEIFTNPKASYTNRLVSMFNDGVVNEGNGKIYDFNNVTGVDTWAANKFIPDGETTTAVDEYKIEMYQTSGALSNQGYQFKKSITFIDTKWIPYFRAGNLTGFIAQLQANIDLSWNLYMFDKLATLITGSSPNKSITGHATNAFDAWALDIIPEIRAMTTYSSDYNYKAANKNLFASNVEDLFIIASPKTIQTLESGIKSQLFNPKALNIGGLISGENFFNLGKKLTIGNQTATIANQTNNYIDDTTIFVVHKDAIKHFTQVDRIESQFFAHNLSTTIVMHKWGALDFLPWGQIFKYTNNNLNTMP